MNITPKILIVEDSNLVRKFLKKTLLKQKYEVFEAENGQIAMNLLEDGLIPDLCLFDVEMPYVNGYDLTLNFRNDPKFENIPVIILTSYEEKDKVVEFFNLGANDFIQKPCNREELIARVNNYLKIKSLNDKLMNTIQELEEKNRLIEESARLERLLNNELKEKSKIIKYIQMQVQGPRSELIANGEVSIPKKIHGTICFSDLKNFTKLSSCNDPVSIGFILEKYLEAVIPEIIKYNGVIDKLEGDAIMYIFGVKTDYASSSPGHFFDAINASLAMQRKMNEFNEYLPNIIDIEIELLKRIEKLIIETDKIDYETAKELIKHKVTAQTIFHLNYIELEFIDSNNFSKDVIEKKLKLDTLDIENKEKLLKTVKTLYSGYENLKNDLLNQEEEDKIEMRIGIATTNDENKILYLNIGNSAVKDLTVIGNQVNKAARVEASSVPGLVGIEEVLYEKVKDYYEFYKSYKIDDKVKKLPLNINLKGIGKSKIYFPISLKNPKYFANHLKKGSYFYNTFDDYSPELLKLYNKVIIKNEFQEMLNSSIYYSISDYESSCYKFYHSLMVAVQFSQYFDTVFSKSKDEFIFSEQDLKVSGIITALLLNSGNTILNQSIYKTEFESSDNQKDQLKQKFENSKEIIKDIIENKNYLKSLLNDNDDLVYSISSSIINEINHLSNGSDEKYLQSDEIIIKLSKIIYIINLYQNICSEYKDELIENSEFKSFDDAYDEIERIAENDKDLLQINYDIYRLKNERSKKVGFKI